MLQYIYQDGFIANALFDKKQCDNPYPIGCCQWDDWNQGWEDAQDDIDNKLITRFD